MAGQRKSFIVAALRKRIQRGLQTRALNPGDRLPSTRDIGVEFGVDPRMVLAAYTALADEGLVELRPRSGVFVATVIALPGEKRMPTARMLTDTMVGAVVRGFSLRDYTNALHQASFGRKVRFAVVAGTLDQAEGLCRELLADYGIECFPILPDQLTKMTLPAAVERAHVLLTTQNFGAQVEELGRKLGKQVIVASVRPSIMTEEWRTLLRAGRIYVVVVDTNFFALVQGYLAAAVNTDNLKMLVAGKDDLSIIPPNAPTYVTQAARRRLGKTHLPGRLIEPVRVFAEDCVRSIVEIIVAANLEGDIG